jgi:predicted TIM-barrel fold metal-dependent hydrolase
MIVDVSAYIGAYPFRLVPRAAPDDLLREMDRLGITQAWVGDLAAPWHRDPRASNRQLVDRLAAHPDRLIAVPTVHPGLPRWDTDVATVADGGAPAIRVYPCQQGVDPAGGEMHALVLAAAERQLPVVLTVRFEDLRQRHPRDAAPDLPAAAVRQLARVSPDARLLVTHAERDFIEEVHFGLAPDEASRVLWEFSWVWGPPEDHLAGLLEHVGDRRFTFGTGMPLRIGDGALAKLDLLDLSGTRRQRLTAGNLREWHKWPPQRWLPSEGP